MDALSIAKRPAVECEPHPDGTWLWIDITRVLLEQRKLINLHDNSQLHSGLASRIH